MLLKKLFTKKQKFLENNVRSGTHVALHNKRINSFEKWNKLQCMKTHIGLQLYFGGIVTKHLKLFSTYFYESVKST